MRKILSLCLVLVLILSMAPAAFAAWGCVDCGSLLTENCPICKTSYCAECKMGICDCNATLYSNGTQVEYNADDSDGDGQLDNLAYTITVPALLAPGGSGTVTIQGRWPSSAIVKVTAEDKVKMVNNINSADKKELAVTFASIEKAGSNTAIVTASAPVSVADIENALFGTWSGKFNYNVDYVVGSGTIDPSDPDQPGGGEEISFIYQDVTFKAYSGETWGEYVARDAFGSFMSIKDNLVIMDDFYFFVNDKGEKQYADTVIVDGMIYSRGTSVGEQVTLITFTIDGTEYQAEEGMTWREWAASDYNTCGATASAGSVVINGDSVFCGMTKQYGDTIIAARQYTVIISFVITLRPDSTNTSLHTCYAESGMTWAEWVESDYNTVNASISTDGNNYLLVSDVKVTRSGGTVLTADMKPSLNANYLASYENE